LFSPLLIESGAIIARQSALDPNATTVSKKSEPVSEVCCSSGAILARPMWLPRRFTLLVGTQTPLTPATAGA
jgi:hypothetical protein